MTGGHPSILRNTLINKDMGSGVEVKAEPLMMNNSHSQEEVPSSVASVSVTEFITTEVECSSDKTSCIFKKHDITKARDYLMILSLYFNAKRKNLYLFFNGLMLINCFQGDLSLPPLPHSMSTQFMFTSDPSGEQGTVAPAPATHVTIQPEKDNITSVTG